MKMNRIGTAEAMQIGQFLEKEHLQIRWLWQRLQRDYNIYTDYSWLCTVLTGREKGYGNDYPLIGQKTQKMLFRAWQITERYRAAFPEDSAKIQIADIPERIISPAELAQIRTFLEEEYLMQTWVRMILERDYEVIISESKLQLLLTGKAEAYGYRVAGYQTEHKLIFIANVIERYERTFRNPTVLEVIEK